MKKLTILTAALAGVVFASESSLADATRNMEKCKVVDAEGKGLIKEHKADCASKNSSCSGSNKAGDPEAWIMVPAGECVKINKGDFSGVSDDIKNKIEGAEK